MKKRYLMFIEIIIFFIIISIFYYKNNKNVNNISEAVIVDDRNVLNISSYKANVTVEVYSNKNTNKYKLLQWYISPDLFKQEVVEPVNIKGLTLLYSEKNLEITNSIFSLSNIYENYKYLDNNLSLIDFIEINDNKKIDKEENDEEVILKLETDNKYNKYKILTLEKNTLIPKKLEIKDNNKKTVVYILYNDITINNTTQEDLM
jgi:outer membrane lipoprotein-sorting protein